METEQKSKKNSYLLEMDVLSKIKQMLYPLLILGGILSTHSQTFTYSGYIYGSNAAGISGVPVSLYKRTTPTMTGFTSQTNYNGHSYYRSTGTATWTASKAACEAMNGHLVTFSNAAENTFVYNTWPSGWIGYYQDRVTGFAYSEPLGGYRWTELPVSNGLQADYDVASYTSGTTLTDIKGAVNTTLYNSPTYTSTSGKYLTFNGTNQYGITNNLASKVTGVTTSLMVWIYPTGNGVIVTELGTGSPSSGWHDSQIEITGGNTLRVAVWGQSGNISTAITLNTWNLVGFTYDGTTLTGYKNGASFGTATVSRQAPVQNGNGLYYGIGLTDSTNLGSGAYGAFRLGDFQVFDRGITADEVNRMYNLYAYRYGIYPLSNWNGGEPNDSGGEDYAQFVSGGKWNDLNNNSSLNYVLEFDYIVDYTPWTLVTTSTTDATGRYSFSNATNPSIEYYITFNVPAPTTPSLLDGTTCNSIVTGITTIKAIDYFRFDTNGDNRLTVSDTYSIMAKTSGLLSAFTPTPLSRILTSTEWSAINPSTANLRATYPGVQSITINTPTSGGSSNYYITRLGNTN